MRFYHCGDIGDIVFSLPTVRALGGGTIYLDPLGGGHLDVVRRSTYRGRMKFDQEAMEYLAPLLRHQAYLDAVSPWNGQAYDVCLVEARAGFDPQRNIVAHYTSHFGVDYAVSDEPWLDAPEEPAVQDAVVVTRTLRYQCNYPEWMNLLHGLRDERVLFLGLPYEHDVFCRTFEVAPVHYPVRDALHAAAVIRSCRRYISNQGANHAIAVGLAKEPFEAETQFNEAVCRFDNRRIRYF